MKDLNLLVWLTQLGLSVALPLAGCTILGVWLRNRFDLGVWVVLCGCALGIFCAIDGFRYSMKAMTSLYRKKEEEPPVSYNDHE